MSNKKGDPYIKNGMPINMFWMLEQIEGALKHYHKRAYVVLISHKHGEDVELYCEEPNQDFLDKIKERFNIDGDDCSVEYLYSMPIKDIATLEENNYDC